MLFAKYFHIFIIQPQIKISAQLSFQNITLISGELRAQQCAPIDSFFYFCLYFRPNANKYLTDRSFVKNHKRNDCYEIFSCGYPFCKKTLDKNIGDKKNIIKFKEKTNLIGEYNFENIIFKRISKKQEYSV